MEAKYEHKTEELGASWDTDYKVIGGCIPDCPACAYKAGIREVVEWIQYHLPDYEFGDEWQAQLKSWGIEEVKE